MNYLNEVKWNKDGLVTAIAQDINSGKVLTLAWMNKEALKTTVEEGRVVYWSRSRGNLWRKGEQSGFVQKVCEIRLDCDGDCILLAVEQKDQIACHTGRGTCFYKRYDAGAWVEIDPVLKEPVDIYS